MRHLKFHYAKAQNILCFGDDGIELNFTNYGRIIQIHGENLDLPGTEANPASNASGKSSVQEILSIGLYGRQVKDPTKLKGGNIVNVLASKGSIEIQFDNYRIVRTFRRSSGSVTSKLRVWESIDRIWDDEAEKTMGRSADTQKWIDGKIGLNHHAFCNVIIFDDSNKHSFLESDTPTKREFVENLLGLDQYREYHQNAKDYFKEQKKLVVDLSDEYERTQQQIIECDQRISKMKTMETQWDVGKKREMKDLFVRMKSKQSELETTDLGEQVSRWEETQEKIEELNSQIIKREANKGKVNALIQETKDKLEIARSNRDSAQSVVQEHVLALNSIKSELQKHLDLTAQLEDLHEGTTCPTCHGIINRENYGHVLGHSREVADKCRSKVHTENLAIREEKTYLGDRFSSITNTEENIAHAELKVSSINTAIAKMQREIVEFSRLPKPEGDAALQVLESQITEIKLQLKTKKSEYDAGSPYIEMLEQAEADKVQKAADKESKGKELEVAEKEIPYIQYWSEAFGDSGIRKYVIEGIIPALNSRIGYWMQFLIEGKMEIVFDNKLEAIITRNGNSVDYYSTSNGERRRINLAVSQAFAYVMMLNSGSCPSLVFLDEITGGGIDRSGVVGVYNMIFELAKERQVFVTTHNENLISMLQGCEKIKLKKQNDITVLV